MALNVILTDFFYALALGLMLFALPYGVGLLFFPRGERDTGLLMLIGMLAVFSLFEGIYLPFFFLKLPFSLLTAVFFVLVVALAVGGFLLRFHKVSRLSPLPRTAWSKKEKRYAAVFALLFLFQTLRVTAGAGTWNIDDAWYLTIANDAIYSDTILGIDPVTGLFHDYTTDLSANAEYIFSPWPLFWAMFAKLYRFPITLLMRTILPFYFLAVFYYVLYRLILFLFESREKALLALPLLAVFYEFTAIAMNVRYTWILCYPWMGKGFGPSVICPLTLLLFLLCREEQDRSRRRVLWAGVFLSNLAGCMVASSCAELNIIILGCWGLVSVIETHKVTLLGKLGLCVLPSLVLMASHLV